MQAKKTRRRAAGAGRKPVEPGGSGLVMLRIGPVLRQGIDRLAKRRKHTRSQEIREALKFWTMRHERHGLHIEALAAMIALLVSQVERHTGKRWNDDALTGEVVRQGVERLIFHFAPTPSKPMVVPPELSHITGFVLTAVETAAQPGGMRFEDDRGLAQMLRDLGSGWQRNRAAWGIKS